MLKKTILISISALLFSIFGTSQDFQKRWKDVCAKNDTLGQTQLLKDWSASNPRDPELYIAYYNYYIRKSAREIISLNSDRKGKEGFALSDSTGKEVAFMSSSVQYDPEILQKGFNYINEAISLYPTRLDMRFGRIYMLGKIENYGAFAKAIVETIDYGNSIKNAWLWKEGKPLEDSKEFFLGSIQEYNSTLYNTGDDKLLPHMRQISEAVLNYYPTHVESLTNVALTYIVVGEYDKGLPYLLKAETISPKDIVVLNNIAQVYSRKNDKTNAKAYFEKVIKYGDKEEAEHAREGIKKLQ